MLLPIGTAFGAIPRVAIAIPTRAVELRTILARTIEFRTLAKRTIAFGTIAARARKTRTFIAAIAVARLVVTRLVELWTIEIPRALASGTRIALRTIRRGRLSLLPRFGIAAVPAKFPVAIRTTAEILAGAARKLFVAVEFSFRTPGKRPIAARTITIPRPCIERAVASRPIAVLAEPFATRRVGPLLATFSRRVSFLVAEFPVLETPRRSRVITTAVRAIATRRVRAFFTATIFARPERTLLAVAASGRPVAIRPITAPTRCIAIFAARRAIVALSGIRAPFTVSLAAEAALGEFLLRPPRNTRAALATGRAVAPAAGIVVFIVVAGHERRSFRCR